MVGHRPKILLFTDWFLPGFKGGGPIRTIAGMVEKLAEDADFLIVTRDRDLGDSRPYSSIVPGHWNNVGLAKVYYWPLGLIAKLKLLRTLTRIQYDIIYLNSLFSAASTLFPLLCWRFRCVKHVPIIIAPRGELSLGALVIKGAKKRLFLALAKRLGLYGGVLWHASSSLERDDILRQFGGAARRVLIAPNLAQRSTHESRGARCKTPGILCLVTLSRISRKKNLDFTLRLLQRVKGNVRLDIYGPCEDIEYWRSCEGLISQLPGNIIVRYMGEIPHERVISTLSDYDFFIFPTLGENFGHVIRESLASGVPVIISDRTPWRDLEKLGVGWDLPLEDPDRYVDVIHACVATSDEAYGRLSANARHYADAIVNDSDVIEANRRLFAPYHSCQGEPYGVE